MVYEFDVRVAQTGASALVTLSIWVPRLKLWAS